MRHPLVGGSLRVLAVALALVLGCSSGHRDGTAGPVAGCARTVDPAAEAHSAVAPPPGRILAVLPQEATLCEEQEGSTDSRGPGVAAGLWGGLHSLQSRSRLPVADRRAALLARRGPSGACTTPARMRTTATAALSPWSSPRR